MVKKEKKRKKRHCIHYSKCDLKKKKQLKFGPLPIHWSEIIGSHEIKDSDYGLKKNLKSAYLIIWKPQPFKTLKKYGLHQATPGREKIFSRTITSIARSFFPTFLHFSLSLSLSFFSAWLLQLPPGWGCSSNPNKTPFFSYWPSWHVMENQANYPYSCFHLLFM